MTLQGKKEQSNKPGQGDKPGKEKGEEYYEVENVKSLKRGFKDHEKAQELLERIAKEVGFIKSSFSLLET